MGASSRNQRLHPPKGQNSVKPSSPIVLAVAVSCSFADEELESNTMGSPSITFWNDVVIPPSLPSHPGALWIMLGIQCHRGPGGTCL